MQYSLLDFLGTSLIPELGSDVTAGTASHAHLILIAVAAVRALPDELAASLFIHNLDLPIVSALHTVIALGIEFGVHNVLINVLHY